MFHSATQSWFNDTFGKPTVPQEQGWPAIQRGEHTLIAAPTGSGKTLAAFLASLDRLFRDAIDGTLKDTVRVIYVSPLKALSNDIHRNLIAPLQGIRAAAERLGHKAQVRAAVRTGDTTPKERADILKHPPHILVTTPESLFLLLTAEKGRGILQNVDTLILDEIHALVGNRRGAHLALTVERLAAHTTQPLQRIGLSATQNPMSLVANYLTGLQQSCTIVDHGHLRQLDLGLILPASPLEAVMSNEVWDQLYLELVELIKEHRTTLIFTNTRRLAERVTYNLARHLGNEAVTSHHGSLSLRTRRQTEIGLKEGTLRAVVATASLELGIDIGHVDLVCQLGSPRAVSTFLQRIGRSGHYLGGVPKGRIFPLTRDELAECTALQACVQSGILDTLQIQEAPIDVLCQQIVAAVACEDWDTHQLYQLITQSYLYRNLPRPEFDRLIYMLADGYETRRGRRGAYLYHDEINHRIKARKGARLAALTNAGAIPDNADYSVFLQPQNTFIGTVNEDFAVESMAGDVFQLGNHSWRVTKIEVGKLLVEDAAGQPPSIPFWFGEAPSRSDALSHALSQLRDEAGRILHHEGDLQEHFIKKHKLPESAAQQLSDYLRATHKALQVLPSQSHLVIERFFDQAGGMQLVIHSPFGARLNRAWGLALRKRFCRSFNFELQAAASDDAIVLSLGPKHSFPLEDVYQFLNIQTTQDVLVQALLDAPMFQTRWRWNATRALAMLRMRGGRRQPPIFQRMDAEDLLAVIFPDQQACLENIAGDREVPDHPLVKQTIDDCLYQFMDLPQLLILLKKISDGSIKTYARDLPEPSPLAHEILNAKPYAFLDDAPLEERRTQSVYLRRDLDLDTIREGGNLNPEAIDTVRQQAWPGGDDVDSVHEALQLLGGVTSEEAQNHRWTQHLQELQKDKRAARLNEEIYIAAETLPQWQAALPEAHIQPAIKAPRRYRDQEWSPESAILAILRRRLDIAGPVTAQCLAKRFPFPLETIEMTLLGLEGEGVILRGSFDPELKKKYPDRLQFCDRRLLARIHQQTIGKLRAQIQPVSPQAFMRFLFNWQGLTEEHRKNGIDGLDAVLSQLEGFQTASATWEKHILPLRCNKYNKGWLDQLCLSGKITWGRPSLKAQSGRSGTTTKATPISFFLRENLDIFCPMEETPQLKGYAAQVWEALMGSGALFFAQIQESTRMLATQVEEGLRQLIGLGLVHSDSFDGLRAILIPAAKKPKLTQSYRRRFSTTPDVRAAGRWSQLPVEPPEDGERHAWEEDCLEYRARLLLRRWGVVFRKLLDKEIHAPSWGQLLPIYRRLEARGEIRGGRFVESFSGEQFALPQAIPMLRKQRDTQDATFFTLHAQDPLCLMGIITPGDPLARQTENRILYQDGLPVAVMESGEVKVLGEIDPMLARLKLG